MTCRAFDIYIYLYTQIFCSIFLAHHIYAAVGLIWMVMKDVQVSDWKPICGGKRDPKVVKHQMGNYRLQQAKP